MLLDTESMDGDSGFLARYPGPASWSWGGLAAREGGTAWYRRAPYPDSFRRVQPRYRRFVEAEFRDVVTACLNGLRVRWLSAPDAVHAAENKPHQLGIAAACGLAVPRTIVTSSPRQAREFLREASGPVVVKPIATPFSRKGAGRAVFTSLLDADRVASLDDARTCPILLQDFVSKADEWRVTVVGRRVFAVSIRPRAGRDFPVDWRLSDPRELTHRPVRLPPRFERAVLKMTSRLGLGFCSMDAVVGGDGTPYFLDLNPGGQWLWLEEEAGVPISRAIADWLSRPGR